MGVARIRCVFKDVPAGRLKRQKRRIRARRAGREAETKMKPKVLIVDDDGAIRQQLFWMLCDEYEVMTAGDLASAIRRATIYEPDIAILDLHLPPTLHSPETGMWILEYVKGHFPSSKVFVVSSEADIEMQKACLRAGAEAFISKPLDIERLLSEVRNATPACQLAAA